MASTTTETPKKPMMLTNIFLEQFTVIPNIFFFGLYLYILLKRRVFHPNLLLIFILLPLTPLIALITKLILVVSAIFEASTPELNSIMYLISDTVLTCSAFTLFTLSIERIVASALVHRYETFCSKVPWLTIGLYSVQIITASMLIPASNSDEDNMSGVAVVVIVLSTFVLAFFVFVSLPLVSRRAYEKAAFSSVGRRYQSAQNLKSAKIMKILVPYTFVCNILFVIGFACLFGLFYSAQLGIYMRIYFVLLEFQIMGTMCIIVFSQDTLKNELFSMLGRETTVKQQNIRGVTGNKMIFHTNQEREVYFKTYQDAWANGAPTA